MRNRLILVVIPPEGGLQTVQGSRRYLHGGERYRSLAEAILSPRGEVRHIGWVPGLPLDAGAESLVS